MDELHKTTTWHTLAATLILLWAVVVVFGQVGGHEFLIWDDDKHVVENPHLNPVTWHGVKRFWQEPYWGLYIPLSYTVFAAEATIDRQPVADDFRTIPNSTVFHLGNLALHLGCVLLVFVILRRIVRDDLAACAGALLFALHPMQVESVAWISETRGLLCGLFSLTAIWCYLAHGDTSSSRSAVFFYVAATVAFLSALLCKPAAVAVPLVIGVLILGLLRQPWRRAAAGLALWLAIAAAWVVLTKSLQPDEQLAFVAPLWARPLVAGDALAFYLAKLLLPLNLSPDYGRTPQWVLEYSWVYAIWLIPATVAILLACLPGRRTWLTAAGIFVAWLVPVLGFVPFAFQRISTVADRYLYLALLGPALALSWFLARHRSRWAWAATGAILILLGVLSFRQASQWQDNDTLLAYTLHQNPQSATAGHNRGHLLALQGKHDEAITRYRRVLKSHPKHLESHLSLAASLGALRLYDEAIAALRETTQALPHSAPVLCQLGSALAEAGKTRQAEEQFGRALELEPDHIKAHLALAGLLVERGRIATGVEHYRHVLNVSPDHVGAHINLGAALRALGKPDEAKYHYHAVLKIRPKFPSAHYNLGIVLTTQGDFDRAAEHFRKAIQYAPNHTGARINLGVILIEKLDRPEEAMEQFRAALDLVPEDSDQANRIHRLLREYQQQ